jgi:hypothetical protein
MPVITTAIGRTARSHFDRLIRQTESRRIYGHHRIRSPIAATYSGASSTNTSTQPDKIDRTRRRRASSPPPLEHAYAHAWAVSRAREYRVCRIDVKCTPIHAPARAESVWEADSGNNPRQRPESN